MITRTICMIPLLAWCSAMGQHVTLLHDSLEARLLTTVNDRERVDLHDQLAMVYIDHLDDRMAIAHLEQGVALATRIHYARGSAYAPLILGLEQLRARDFHSALAAFTDCIDRLDALGVEQGLLSPLGLIRQVYNAAGLQDERLAFYTTKLLYYQAMGPKQNIGACHHGMGGYYYIMGQPDKAIGSYLRAREVFATFDPVGYANQSLPIISLYLSWGNVQKAEEYQQRAIEENLKIGLLTNVIASYVGKAEVQLALGDTTAALNAMSATRRYWGRCSAGLLAPRLLALVSIHLGRGDTDSAHHYLNMVDSLDRITPLPIYSAKGDIELAYFHSRYDRAVGDDVRADAGLEKALHQARQQGGMRFAQKYRKELALRYRERGLIQAALDEMMVYSAVNDSLQKVADLRKVSTYEQEVKERQSALEAQQQQARIRWQRSVMLFSTGFALLLLVLVLLVVRNNSLKQRANRALDAARLRAETSERSKQQFLANMSHEIRTPMNAIMGMTGILKRNDHLPEQKKYLDAVAQSSENLLVVLNDILDMSKIEAGKIQLEQVSFDPRSVIRSVQDILQFKAAEKDIALAVGIDNGVPTLLLGDPTRLQQVLINLAGNAIKFTDQGSVAIQAAALIVDDTNVALRIDVIDTGIGIPLEKQQKIFEEFDQAYSDTNRKYGGTGLGLSISKRLVELQGGSITVRSEKDKGSTFTVTIPYAIVPATGEAYAQGKDDTASNGLRDLRILLAEDNDFNVMVAQDELADAIPGAQVDVAANGRIAVEMVQANVYDVILMDIQMPEMNGYDATKTIRAMDNAKARVPILAMTANVMKEELERCREAGMDGHIPKPFKRVELVNAIAGTLSNGLA